MHHHIHYIHLHIHFRIVCRERHHFIEVYTLQNVGKQHAEMCEHQLKFISEIYFTRKAKIKRKLYFFPEFNGYFYTKPLNWDFISTFRILTMILFIDFNFKYILCATNIPTHISLVQVLYRIFVMYKCLLNKTNFWNFRSTYMHIFILNIPTLL